METAAASFELLAARVQELQHQSEALLQEAHTQARDLPLSCIQISVTVGPLMAKQMFGTHISNAGLPYALKYLCLPHPHSSSPLTPTLLPECCDMHSNQIHTRIIFWKQIDILNANLTRAQ